MTVTSTHIQSHYLIKAYQWLHDHGAKPNVSPQPLAAWLAKAEDRGTWRWAAVTEDGEIVGEAYQEQEYPVEGYYLTDETAQRYGLFHSYEIFNVPANQGLPAIESAIGKHVAWAKEPDMCGQVQLSERALYAQAKAKYNF